MNAQTNVLLSGGLVLLLVVSGVIVVWPVYRARERIEREIAELHQEVSMPSSGPEAIARLRTKLDVLEQFNEDRMTPIPVEADVAGLMQQLNDGFEGLGVTGRELKTGKAQDLDEASSIPMNVRISGAFPVIVEGVRKIESLPRLVRVQRLTITHMTHRRHRVDRSGLVNADLMIDVFYAPRAIGSFLSDAGDKAGGGGQ